MKYLKNWDKVCLRFKPCIKCMMKSIASAISGANFLLNSTLDEQVGPEVSLYQKQQTKFVIFNLLIAGKWKTRCEIFARPAHLLPPPPSSTVQTPQLAVVMIVVVATCLQDQAIKCNKQLPSLPCQHLVTPMYKMCSMQRYLAEILDVGAILVYM